MTKDPVCQMSVDEKKLQPRVYIKGRHIISAQKDARKSSTKNLKNMSKNQQRTKVAVINAHNKI